MRQAIAPVIAMLFLTSGLAAFGGAGAPHSQVAPNAMTPRATDSNGVEWGDDVRLTDNPAGDGHPQLAVSTDGATGVAWSRGGNMMWMKVDMNGDALVREEELVHGLPVQESGFLPPYICADSHGDYQLVSSQSDSTVDYAKLASNGSFLVSWKSITTGAVQPYNPSIAISPNDIVHVIYEDYRWGYSALAVTYARLLDDGTVDKDGVRISGPGWFCDGSTLCTDDSGQVHAAFLNTADGGAYHGMLDVNGDPLTQAPDVILYWAGSFWTNGPPSICCDPTGAVWALWNDHPQNAGTLKFMKLDNYGNKLAAGPGGNGIPLTAGSTCVGFPSIASDSAGNIYAVWSDDRDGNDRLYYVCIAPGTENDSGLPDRAICLTSDDTGSAMEPNVAIGADNNVRVVWKDNRDGNWEIYYKPGLHQSIITAVMDQEEMDKISFVHPNETKKARLTVSNIGNIQGAVNLSLECDFHGHPGWNVSIGQNNISLEPGSYVNVTVKVASPPTGVPNDFIDFCVTAVSVENPRNNSTVSFRTYLVIDEDFRLDGSDKVHAVAPGEQTVFVITATSTGGRTADIELTAAGPPDWNWSLSTDRLRLAPGQGANLTLAVTPPTDAKGGDFALVSVTGQLVQEPDLIRSIVTRTEIQSFVSLEINADREQGYADPGGSASYELTVSETGNLPEPVPISLQAISNPTDWNVSLDTDLLSLAGNESGQALLQVAPPVDALAGESLNVTVICFNEDWKVRSECNVTTVVGQTHSVRLAVTPANASTNPGRNASYDIEIDNLGNGPEPVNGGRFVLPDGWNISFYLMGGSDLGNNWGVPLGVCGTMDIIATVSTPGEALAGDYEISGELLDGAGDSFPVQFGCAIDQVYGVALDCAAPVQSGGPGDRLLFPLNVTDRGNCYDNLTFNASGFPEGWPGPYFVDAGTLLAAQMNLTPGETGRLLAVVDIPASTPLDSFNFSATIISRGGASASIDLFVGIKKPDLAIAGITLSTDDLRVGGLVLVNVTVENLGDAPTGNFTLAYYRNEEPRISRPVGAIPPGGKDTESFVWIPREGSNEIRFIVDPDNTICESNESNNEAAIQKDVRTETVSIPKDETWMVLAAMIPLIGLALAALVQWLRRPERPSTRIV